MAEIPGGLLLARLVLMPLFNNIVIRHALGNDKV